MSKFHCPATLACFVFAFAIAGAADAKEFILRYDVLEVEYDKGDIDRTGEPTRTTLRSVEVTVDEKSDFAVARIDKDWELKLSGKSTGFADGKLQVEKLSFGCAAIDGATSTTIGAPLKSHIESSVQFVGGGGSTHIFHSIREPAKTDRENEEQCAEIRKTVLEQFAKRREEHIARVQTRSKTALRVLELAQQQLKQAENEAVGRELLELVIQKYGDTKSGREAKQIWNDLPGATYKYPLDGPFGRGF